MTSVTNASPAALDASGGSDPREVRRVLDRRPVTSLADHVENFGGGVGLATAMRSSAGTVLDTLDQSGLRGRGGAGFPTGRKWRSIIDHLPASGAVSVVINAAEGEPGSYKDRTLLQVNPYRVLEGALIAATTVGASRVTVALKASFDDAIRRVRGAVAELAESEWTQGIEIDVVEGPDDYLFGEETALLEAIAGRPAEPRVAPPYRRGLDGDDADDTTIDLASVGPGSDAAPALVNNVETFAHVAQILAHGADWFRLAGTEESPGTVVCTVTGATRQHGVGEFPMGVTVADVIDAIGGGSRDSRTHTALLSGVANAFLPADDFESTRLTHESFEAHGSGLGAAGFIVFDESDDLVAVAAGVARFLAEESCGQCRPCEVDGAAIAERFERAHRRELQDQDLSELERLFDTVVVGARCNLAVQQATVGRSLTARFPEVLADREQIGDVREPYRIAPIESIVDGVATLA